jgi:hypothetical protein
MYAIGVGQNRRGAILVAQPVVGQAFDEPRQLHLSRRHDAFEHIDRRMTGGDDSIELVPAERDATRLSECHPRSASR